MSTLTFDTLTMPAADLGPVNPLPTLPAAPGKPKRAPHPSLTAEDVRHFGYGEAGVLPYRLQDGYDRSRRPRGFRTAVLENETLRATFLLGLGGRLWSLVHKPTGRELMYVNPVFQPANLAIRNAWFSGGVEWNVGQTGHNARTCSPLFAGVCEDESGRAFLRLWEWDRNRRTPYQLDVHLPDGSAFLLIHVRIDNPRDETVPMYWWSNIAVPEADDVRVLVPAEMAISHNYREGVMRVPYPVHDGLDQSYPTNAFCSADWFFLIPDDRRRWEAALDADGRGLVQTSTPRLKGRKLFVWGNSPGGRQWQEFLSVPGSAYVEIQAGLARTQMEHVPMPARGRWEWLEAYGLIDADAACVHGGDWQAATDAVERKLADMLSEEELEDHFAHTCATADTPPREIVQHGSGWGALERLRREARGERPFNTPATPFPDESLTGEQQPWRRLLADGAMPARDPADPPGAFMTQPEWREMLEESVKAPAGDHWLSWYHLGVMRCGPDTHDDAREAWETSLERTESAWAYRDLAVRAATGDRPDDAADLYLRAWKLAPPLRPLAVETSQALLDADRPADAARLLDELPDELASHGRLKLMRARAWLAAGDADAALDILADETLVVPDIREGEVSLSDLWTEAHARRLAGEAGEVDDELRERARREFPTPKHLDFRMAYAIDAPPAKNDD